MARNKMEDLRDHMFAQLERLSNEEMEEKELLLEVKRAKAIKDVASQIISSAKVEIDFLKTTGSFKTESNLFSNITTKRLE